MVRASLTLLLITGIVDEVTGNGVLLLYFRIVDTCCERLFDESIVQVSVIDHDFDGMFVSLKDSSGTGVTRVRFA